jgi:hypothetical protein
MKICKDFSRANAQKLTVLPNFNANDITETLPALWLTPESIILNLRPNHTNLDRDTIMKLYWCPITKQQMALLRIQAINENLVDGISFTNSRREGVEGTRQYEMSRENCPAR